jgi:hypothetical protein
MSGASPLVKAERAESKRSESHWVGIVWSKRIAVK